MSESLPEFDPYATLGVGRDAPARVVAAAYRTRIRRVHPDLSSDPRSSERAKRLNVARDWLLDPGRRARYDAAHPVRLASIARQSRSRISRTGPAPGWWRSHGRIELEVFAARCNDMTQMDVSRLIARARIARASTDAAIRRPSALATSIGRNATIAASARIALARLPRAKWRDDPAIAAIVRYTALALGTVDLAPWEASVLLRPWREAIEQPDARARARRARLVRTSHAIRTVIIVTLVAVLSGLSIGGALVGVAVLTGWVR